MLERNANETLKKNLLKLITENNISMRKLSSDLDCSASYIQKIIDGQFSPSIEKVYAIADYFGVPATALLWEENTSSTIQEIDTLLIQLRPEQQELVLNLVRQLSQKDS